MDFANLTPEQIEKLKGMPIDELHKLVAEEGIPISNEDLDQIAGGWSEPDTCPSGGTHDWDQTDSDFTVSTVVIPIYKCTKCGAVHRGYI